MEILVFGDCESSIQKLLEQIAQSSPFSEDDELIYGKRELVTTIVDLEEIGYDQLKLRLWKQTDQERPFTTKQFRQADAALFIVNGNSKNFLISKKLKQFSKIIDYECSQRISTHLVCASNGSSKDLFSNKACEELVSQFDLTDYSRIALTQQESLDLYLKDLASGAVLRGLR